MQGRCWLWLVVVSLLLSVTSNLSAQGRPVPQLPKPVASCGPTAIILVTAVDASGAVVGDGTIDVRRISDGKSVWRGPAELPSSGEYKVMEDLSLELVAAKGTRFRVHVQRGGKKASAVMRIGRTADGCHVRRLSGPTRLVLT